MSDATLSEVLEGYAIDTPEGNDQETLRRWMDRHPEFAGELMDFAAARAYARNVDEGPLPEEERYAEIGLNALKEMLGREAAALSSLTAAAEAKGWKKPEFAKKLGLSMSLLMYFEKRRVKIATVPKGIVAKIAELLETSEQAIAAYLSQPPSMAGEASFKSQTRPEEDRQKEFADAVREDQSLSPSEKHDLLSLR